MAQNALLNGFVSDDPLAADEPDSGGVEGSILTVGIKQGL